MNPLFHTEFSISDSLKNVRKSVLIYETIIKCHPSKRIFPEEVVLYELSLRLIGNEGISIEEVLFGEKGIVKIYNLSSVMANDYLDRLDTAGYIRVDRTAGLDMIYPVRELNPRNIIEDFYENN